MDDSTYDYLTPTNSQIETMTLVRQATKRYSDILEAHVPDGPDKTYLIRKLREVSMWANVAITRQPDGSQRH